MSWLNVPNCQHCAHKIDKAINFGDGTLCPNCEKPLCLSISEVADKIKQQKRVRLRVGKGASQKRLNVRKGRSGVLYVVHKPWRYLFIKVMSFLCTAAVFIGGLSLLGYIVYEAVLYIT